MGSLYGFQCPSRPIPRLDRTAHASTGMEILHCMLRILLYTSISVSLHQRRGPWEGVRPSSGKHTTVQAQGPANPGTALVLDHWRMGLSPHRDSLRHSLVRFNDPAPKPTSLTNHRVALISAFVIYCMAGAKVWRNRHDLHEWFNPFNENPFESTVTTEVDVTTHVRRAESPSSIRRPSDGEMPIHGIESQGGGDYVPYTVNVEVGPQDKHQNSAPELFRMRTLTRNAALNEANADAWLYARVAFLFFCALLISWVPSSTNRVYSLAHPDRLNFGLNYTETLVLPLQGFLNAIVYIITSQTACRNLWRSITGAQELPRKSSSVTGTGSDLPLGMGKTDTKLERFAARRTSQRLDSDVTSVSCLRPH